jgi:diacylglycerol O-acyltransferase
VNDVYLAGLLGGFRRYHAALGAPVRDVPLAIPMSTRADGNVAAGNHLSMARLSGPASIEDPALRMVAVHDVVAAVRAEPAVGIIDTLADVLQHVPSALAIRGLTAHARQVDLHASNLMGAPFSVYLAGSRVRAMFPFGPLTGVPVMAVLLSYDGKCGIGLTLDPAAVTDPDLFAACVRDEFAEIAGLTTTAAGRMKTAISG